MNGCKFVKQKKYKNMKKLKSKIALKYNELDLVCRKRVDDIIYSVYISYRENFKNFDSGFILNDWDFEEGIIQDSLQRALNHFNQNLDIKNLYILGCDYSGDYGTSYNMFWITEYPICLIDHLNPLGNESILIHEEENIGNDEDLYIGELNHVFITESLDNFIESGYFKIS